MSKTPALDTGQGRAWEGDSELKEPSQAGKKRVPLLLETDKLGEKLFFRASQCLTHFPRAPGEEQLWEAVVGRGCLRGDRKERKLWFLGNSFRKESHLVLSTKQTSLAFHRLLGCGAWCAVPQGSVRWEEPPMAPGPAESCISCLKPDWSKPPSASAAQPSPGCADGLTAVSFGAPWVSTASECLAPCGKKRGRFLILTSYIWDKQSKC